MERVIARPAEVLLVEDNPGDSLLMKEAFKRSKLNINLSIVADGIEALSFLNKEAQYKDAVRPDLIILDLNLPRKDGLEVLSEIKSHDIFRTIPVIILTSSQAEKDITTAYKFHANSYIVKPFEFSEYLDISKAIDDYWFSLSKIPLNSDHKAN